MLGVEAARLLYQLVGPVGFIIVVTVYEVFAPKLLDRETLLSPLLYDLPEQVDDLAHEQREMRNELGDVKKRQEIGMQVQRAQARATPQMDHSRVDDYLMENGVEVDEFLRGDEMSGYSNWHDEDGQPTDDDVTTRMNDTIGEDDDGEQ